MFGIAETVSRRDLDKLRSILRSDAGASKLATALVLACAVQWTDGVRLLIEHGAPVNESTDEACGVVCVNAVSHAVFVLLMDRRVTAVMVAALNGNEDIFLSLANHGADLNAKTAARRTVFECAAEGGNAKIVQYFLYRGFAVNKPGPADLSILHYGVMGGSPEVVSALLLAGANINARSLEGKTPFMVALERGHEDAAQVLVDAGATLETKKRRNGADDNPLYHACRHGFVRLAEKLLAGGADVNASNEHGSFPLIDSARDGHFLIVEMLLFAGADINVASKNGNETALMAAAFKGHRKVVQILIQGGADLNAQNILGRTALRLAGLGDQPEIVKQLREAGAKMEPELQEEMMREAVLHRASKMLSYLQSEGQSVDSRFPVTQITLLMSAASCGSEVIVKQLIDSGATLELTNFNGEEAVHMAANAAILKQLLDRGVDVDRPSKSGSTPLMKAVSALDVERVDLLLERGANVSAADANGFTALLSLCAFGVHMERQFGRCMTGEDEGKRAQLIAKLIGCGVDVNCTAADGTTALMVALPLRSPACVKVILEAPQLNVNVANKWGTTALMCALAAASDIGFLFDAYRGSDCIDLRSPNGSRDEIETLLKLGADVNAVNRDGWSPLVFAARSGNNDNVRLLLEKGADKSVVARVAEKFQTGEIIRRMKLAAVVGL